MYPFRFLTALAVSALAAAAAHATAPLQYVGQQIVATGTVFQGTVVGGLSGIDYDPTTGIYWSISDDRSQFSAARFYGIGLDLDRFVRSNAPGAAGVQFLSVQTLKTPGGTTYPALAVDPEALRFDPAAGRFFWTSEGDKTLLFNAFVAEMRPDGSFVRYLDTPGKYAAAPNALRGIRNNLAFESLTLSTDRTLVYAAVENALQQDGPASNLASGSPARVIAFDRASGAPVAEYVYPVEPVAAPPSPAGSFSTNGLVELLAVSATDFLAVERSFSSGVGNTIRLYLASIAGATDVLALDALAGQSFSAMTKRLLLDLGTLRNDDGSALVLDNIEGITWGPTLGNGNRTLVLVSDNNFSGAQFTQFVALAVTAPIPEPSTYAMLLAGLALLGCAARRRSRR